MTPVQLAALEGLAGRALTAAELAAIEPLLDPAGRRDDAIAEILSAGRTIVSHRPVSARGLAELYPAGPIGAETVLSKLEAAAASLRASADAAQRVMGSLIERQLRFLAGDGLNFGSTKLRQMLDSFVPAILTSGEVAALKSVAEVADPVDTQAITAALNAVQSS